MLELGRSLHKNGTPAHRLESALEKVAARLGLEAHFFAIPTAIFAAFGPLGAQRSGLVRFEPGGVDLGKIARLDEIVGALGSGQFGVEEALEAVRRVDSAGSPYAGWVRVMAFGLASCAAAGFFGGGWEEILASTLTGLVTGILALALGSGRSRHIFVPLAASFVAVLARLTQLALGAYATDIVVAAGLLILLPGLTLTVALTELSTRHLVSGTARLTAAGLVLAELGIGLVFGDWLGSFVLTIPPPMEAPTPLPPWTVPVTVGLAGMSFVPILSARVRDLPAILLACFIAFYSARGLSVVLDGLLGAWAAALLTALACSLYGRGWDRPATVPLVPAILLLVPGSLGLKSMQWFLAHDPLRATDAALETTLIGLALAVGVVSANLLVSPRREI